MCNIFRIKLIQVVTTKNRQYNDMNCVPAAKILCDPIHDNLFVCGFYREFIEFQKKHFVLFTQ